MPDGEAPESQAETDAATVDLVAIFAPFTPKPREPAAPALARLEFTGTGSEYFRIWVVNLLVTLLTLGLYSPWAKVRKARWFCQTPMREVLQVFQRLHADEGRRGVPAMLSTHPATDDRLRALDALRAPAGG